MPHVLVGAELDSARLNRDGSRQAAPLRITNRFFSDVTSHTLLLTPDPQGSLSPPGSNRGTGADKLLPYESQIVFAQNVTPHTLLLTPDPSLLTGGSTAALLACRPNPMQLRHR